MNKDNNKDNTEIPQSIGQTYNSVAELMLALRGEASKFQNFKIKYYYPIRRFYINKVKDPIRYLIRPCHSELRKVIPKSYCDLDQIIVDINFEIVKSLVEKEYGGIDQLYSEYLAVPQIGGEFDKELVDSWNLFRKQLFNCYKYIVDKRTKLLIDIENSYPEDMGLNKSDIEDRTYEQIYEKQIALEKQLNEMDTLWLNWIINNREYFWT